MPVNVLRRSVLLPRIREERRGVLKSAFAGELMNYELRTYEFLTIATLLQLDICYVLFFMAMVIRNGAISSTVLYILLTGMLGMPLFFLFTFMGSYSRKGYLRFWKCVPLFEGLGYSFIILRLFTEMQNSTLASFSFLAVFKFLSGSMRKGIAICRNSSVNCAAMYPTENVTTVCAPGALGVPTATQYFLISTRHIKSQTFMGEINTKWLCTLTVTWVVIYILSVQGLRYIKKVTVPLGLLCSFFMFLLGVFALLNVPWSTVMRVKLVNWTEGGTILNFDFWVTAILHSADVNVTMSMIWLSSLKPKSLHPKYAALLVSPIKLIAFVCLLSMGACLAKETIVHYRYMDTNCLEMTSFSVLLSMVPDILYRTKVRNLCVPLWYFSLYICSCSTPLYGVISVVDSILDKYGSIRKYRVYVITLICLLCYLGSVYLMIRSGHTLEIIWKTCVVPIWASILLLFVTLALFFIYSTREVIHDYLFTYGCTPEKYWTVAWKTTPIFAILAFILVLHRVYTNDVCLDGTSRIIATHMMSLLVLLPVVAVFLFKCFMHVKRKTLHLLARPAMEWGPYGKQKKIEKSLFFPQRDIKYRNENLKCSHSCLVVHNKRYHQKSLEHQRKIVKLEEEYLALKIV